MWSFETDPEYQADLDWADEFVREEIEPLAFVIPNMLDITDPVRQELIPPLQAQVKERGLWATHLGPELGGQGHGQVKLGLLNEILGRAPLSSIVFGCQAPDTGNAEILAHYGTEEHKKRYLQPLLDGQVFSTYSMTEPQAGSDPKEFTCRAELDGDEWVINGEKWFSSNARWASFLIVMVVTEPGNPPYRRHSMLIVPTDTPGVTIVRNVGVAGWDAEGEGGHAYIRYENVRVPAGEPARRPGRRLRRGPDPPWGRAHPPRHADRRDGQAGAGDDAAARGLPPHPGRAAVKEAARPGDGRRVVAGTRAVPAARAPDGVEDRPLPGLQAGPRRHRRRQDRHARRS